MMMMNGDGSHGSGNGSGCLSWYFPKWVLADTITMGEFRDSLPGLRELRLDPTLAAVPRCQLITMALGQRAVLGPQPRYSHAGEPLILRTVEALYDRFPDFQRMKDLGLCVHGGLIEIAQSLMMTPMHKNGPPESAGVFLYNVPDTDLVEVYLIPGPEQQQQQQLHPPHADCILNDCESMLAERLKRANSAHACMTDAFRRQRCETQGMRPGTP